MVFDNKDELCYAHAKYFERDHNGEYLMSPNPDDMPTKENIDLGHEVIQSLSILDAGVVRNL